jgi:membrane protein YqaA with SNARE-associated domain
MLTPDQNNVDLPEQPVVRPLLRVVAIVLLIIGLIGAAVSLVAGSWAMAAVCFLITALGARLVRYAIVPRNASRSVK